MGSTFSRPELKKHEQFGLRPRRVITKLGGKIKVIYDITHFIESSRKNSKPCVIIRVRVNLTYLLVLFVRNNVKLQWRIYRGGGEGARK